MKIKYCSFSNRVIGVKYSIESWYVIYGIVKLKIDYVVLKKKILKLRALDNDEYTKWMRQHTTFYRNNFLHMLGNKSENSSGLLISQHNENVQLILYNFFYHQPWQLQ